MSTKTKRPPQLRLHTEIIVDNFAGGGGASLGIEWAMGRSPDIAINHDPEAIAMHQANHPGTKHVTGDVWDVKPKKLCAGRRVALAWFSPDCTHHSKAKGGKPREKGKAEKSRALAWVVVRWARDVKPRVIILENVEEFADWGPLHEDGSPDKLRKGLTFRRWIGSLKAAGYEVECRELRAHDFGAPTIRKRLFVIARSDGQPIVWPEPTHGPGRAHPHRVAAECIQWELPCPSIFDRERELAEKTMRRIARGIMRYVVNAARPFVVPVTHCGDLRSHSVDEPLRTVTSAHRGEFALVAPTLVQTGYGERPPGPNSPEGQAPRCLDIQKPLGTIVGCGGRHALVTAFLAKHYGGGYTGPGAPMDAPMHTVTTADHHALVTSHMLKLFGTCQDGQPVDLPAPTVTAGGTHLGEVRAFLTRYNGVGDGQVLTKPVGTLTTHDRFGLVTVAGEAYAIADIGMRMLQPRELFRAQGFDDSYIIDPIVNGKPLTKTAQTRMCGNSVCPTMAHALVRANIAQSQVEVA